MGDRPGAPVTTGSRVIPALFARALNRVDFVSAVAIITAMGVMVAIVAVQVFLRYLFNESLDWADELSRLCFVWAIFLAIPHALRRGAHVGIDLVVAMLPAAARVTVFRATSCLAALLMSAASYYAITVARATWDQLMPTINASAGFFYVAVAVGCGHSVLHLIRLTLRGRHLPLTTDGGLVS